jgi:hypothetical protein
VTTVDRLNLGIVCLGCDAPVEMVMGLAVVHGRARLLPMADTWLDHVAAHPACDGTGIAVPYRTPATPEEYRLIRAVVRSFEEGG